MARPLRERSPPAPALPAPAACLRRGGRGAVCPPRAPPLSCACPGEPPPACGIFRCGARGGDPPGATHSGHGEFPPPGCRGAHGAPPPQWWGPGGGPQRAGGGRPPAPPRGRLPAPARAAAGAARWRRWRVLGSPLPPHLTVVGSHLQPARVGPGLHPKTAGTPEPGSYLHPKTAGTPEPGSYLHPKTARTPEPGSYLHPKPWVLPAPQNCWDPRTWVLPAPQPLPVSCLHPKPYQHPKAQVTPRGVTALPPPNSYLFNLLGCILGAGGGGGTSRCPPPSPGGGAGAVYSVYGAVYRVYSVYRGVQMEGYMGGVYIGVYMKTVYKGCT
ncbi:basic proline-rich protein-like [Strigops habroptila]|uniref:basic proline-rich protein-like n=1 Tax=Strigops habroptila TaxID=2489341 RepID=UPI0011D00566|nr:basic proline-rich protein-like [Strigops habroptila]